MKTAFEKLQLKFSTFPDRSFEGYMDAKHSNDGRQPFYFDFSQAVLIAEAYEKLGIATCYNQADDKFIFKFPGEPEECQAVLIQNQKLYPISNLVTAG